ncbi:hypothetical protein An08g01530 [Aspergillus niger]|uniref:Uncharacterized protein n=2 Tax=Aspergillus niger TaxID=5061 RepID=A2QQ76_ASPNC|nr:hypothetical protein An08g01530 [Aspergillus niger]CAK39833.1 hypothetical protein An08g01530 [Aspergillus niger]
MIFDSICLKGKYQLFYIYALVGRR